MFLLFVLPVFSLAPSNHFIQRAVETFRKGQECISTKTDIRTFHMLEAIENTKEAPYLVFDIDDTLAVPDHNLSYEHATVLCELLTYKKLILFISNSNSKRQFKNKFIPQIEKAIQIKDLIETCHRRIFFIFPDIQLVFDKQSKTFVVWTDFNQSKDNHFPAHTQSFKKIFDTPFLQTLLDEYPHQYKDIHIKKIRRPTYIQFEITQKGQTHYSSLFPSKRVCKNRTTVFPPSFQQQPLSNETLPMFVRHLKRKVIPLTSLHMYFIQYPTDNSLSLIWLGQSKYDSFQLAKKLLHIKEGELTVYFGDSFDRYPCGIFNDSSMIGTPDVVNISVQNTYPSRFWSQSSSACLFRKKWHHLDFPLLKHHIGNILCPHGFNPNPQQPLIAWEILSFALQSLQKQSYQPPVPLIKTNQPSIDEDDKNIPPLKDNLPLPPLVLPSSSHRPNTPPLKDNLPLPPLVLPSSLHRPSTKHSKSPSLKKIPPLLKPSKPLQQLLPLLTVIPISLKKNRTIAHNISATFQPSLRSSPFPDRHLKYKGDKKDYLPLLESVKFVKHTPLPSTSPLFFS